jgi:hypothetical protein
LVKVQDWQRGREILARRIRSQFAWYQNNEKEFPFLLMNSVRLAKGKTKGFPIHYI